MLTNESWRSRSAREARSLLERAAPAYGITRVADLTGLDWLGFPVAASFRPSSYTLSTSQGKSLSSLDGAIAGAIMESIEVWHAERVVADVETVSARCLSLPYDINSLTSKSSHPDLADYNLDWVNAVDMVSGKRTFLPLTYIRLDFRLAEPSELFEPMFFTNSSNGLAGGNSFEEAALHALYEIIERDSLSRANAGLTEPIGINVDEYLAMLPREVADTLVNEDIELEVFAYSNPFGIPTFSATLWTDDFNVACIGSGSHAAPHIALGRAISEAAQTRITHIAGARDDIDITDFDQVDRGYSLTEARPFDGTTAKASWREMAAPTDPAKHLSSLLEVFTASGTASPVIASLAPEDGEFAVVKASVADTQFGVDKAYSGKMPLPAVARV